MYTYVCRLLYKVVSFDSGDSSICVYFFLKQYFAKLVWGNILIIINCMLLIIFNQGGKKDIESIKKTKIGVRTSEMDKIFVSASEKYVRKSFMFRRSTTTLTVSAFPEHVKDSGVGKLGNRILNRIVRSSGAYTAVY